jgi:type I restriction enzyme S subunit
MRDGWRVLKLGDFCEIQQGQNLAISQLTTGRYPVYGANGVVGHFDEYNFSQKVVALGCRGSCGTIHVVQESAWLANNVMAVWPKDESDTLCDFIALLLEIADLKSTGVISGQVQPQITRTSLKPLECLVPALSDQRRIVDLVASVDIYIESLQHQVDAARTARNVVLHDLLSSGGDDWTETTISEVLQLSIGGIWGEDEGSSDADVLVYRQTEFDDEGRLSIPSQVTRSISLNQLKSRRLKPGDVLLQKSAGTPSLPGRVVRVPDGIEDNSTCSNFLQLLRADQDSCDPGFLFWDLWHRHKSGGAFEFQRGTNIRNLDLRQYLSQRLLLPPMHEQHRIVQLVESVDDVCRKSSEACTSAKLLRSGLLADLLSGEHEIPESYDRFLGAA